VSCVHTLTVHCRVLRELCMALHCSHLLYKLLEGPSLLAKYACETLRCVTLTRITYSHVTLAYSTATVEAVISFTVASVGDRTILRVQ
jgi:hypothetical protein